MFKARCQRDADYLDFTWDAGQLTGPEPELTWLLRHIADETVAVPCFKYWTGQEILKSDLATSIALNQYFDSVTIIKGEVKEQIPPIPPDAVS